MKIKSFFKSFLALALAIIMLALTGCGTYSGGIGSDSDKDTDNNTDTDISTPIEDKSKYTVKVMFDGKYLDPNTLLDEGEEKTIKAVWTNGFSYHEATFDENGEAVATGLDGDYRVSLSDLPEGYSYNPNLYVARSNKKEVVIEIYDYKPTRGTGANRYDKSIKISKIGLYQAKLDDKDDVVFYQFTPKESGKYLIESWADVSSNTVNPKLEIYHGQAVGASYYVMTLDDGAEGDQGTFTKNFAYEWQVAPSEIGNAFIFGIKADVNSSTEKNIDINFAITLNGAMNDRINPKELMVPFELLEHLYTKIRYLKGLSREEYEAFMKDKVGLDTTGDESDVLKTLDFPELELTFDENGEVIKNYTGNHKNLYDIIMEGKAKIEVDGETVEESLSALRDYLKSSFASSSGSYHYAESDILGAEGRKLFDQNMYKISPDDGFYHLYDIEKYKDTNGYGPILYADITQGGRFLGAGLNSIEYEGNKALNVDDAKNYKHFIEGYLSLITHRGAYPNIIPAYYCSYMGEDPRITTNCPCIYEGCDRACYEGCEKCTSDCRFIPLNLDYAVGYADLANSDGRVPVTLELKEFLQSFSISQRYFADGNGWVEENPNYAVDAPEDSQWLWACGYYE